ncbi:MAG: alpha/beta hydrolase [Pseudomonadota bacterium]|nr:alpha/beta hydrolase [Pseudomonadota bacterium]
MTLDPEMAALLEALRALPRFETMTPLEVRAATEDLARNAPAGPHLHAVEDRRVATVACSLPVRIYRPEHSVALIVYFHGGGWVIGNLDSADAALRDFAHRTRCCIVSVDYRLAPEHPFPAAVMDAENALNWAASACIELAGQRVPLLLAGESAGGTLAAVTAILARDHQGPSIAGQILFYPVTNSDLTTPSYDAFAEDYFLTRPIMRWFWNHYAPQEHQRRDFRAAPLLTKDLTHLPPALIQTAEYDPLRDEGEAFGRRLAAAGVQVTVQRRAGLVHSFVTMAPLVRAARAAVDDAIEWVGQRVANATAAK